MKRIRTNQVLAALDHLSTSDLIQPEMDTNIKYSSELDVLGIIKRP